MAMSQELAADLMQPEKQLVKSIKAATTVLQEFSHKKNREVGMDKFFPLKAIKEAKALVVLVEYKVGAILSGTTGKGLIMKRLEDGRWSAPSALGSESLGVGFAIGATTIEHVIALFDENAIKTYAGKAKLKFGSDVTVASGPAAANNAADTAGAGHEGAPLGPVSWAPPAGALTWTHSKGVYGGASLETGLVHSDGGDNKKFYGKDVTIEQIFSGEVPPPEDAVSAELYKALADMESRVIDKASVASTAASVGEAGAEAAPMEEDQAGATAPSAAEADAAAPMDDAAAAPDAAAPMEDA